MHDCEVCASREDVAFCSRNSDLLRDIHPIAVVVAAFFVQGDFYFFRLDNLLRLCAFAISPEKGIESGLHGMVVILEPAMGRQEKIRIGPVALLFQDSRLCRGEVDFRALAIQCDRISGSLSVFSQVISEGKHPIPNRFGNCTDAQGLVKRQKKSRQSGQEAHPWVYACERTPVLRKKSNAYGWARCRAS